MNKSKNSVLIVDDNEFSTQVLVDILGSEYIVYEAKNGQEAIKMAEEHLPDVILLDIVMPEMDGYAVITALKLSEKTCGIPVIFITAFSNRFNEEKGLALGAADYITKPFNAAIVRLRVQNQIKMFDQLRANEYNVMKYRQMAEALKRRETMLDTLNKTAIVFLSQSKETFEDMMSLGIEQIADLFDIDRFSLFRNFSMPDGLHSSQIYRWDRASGGTTPPTKFYTDMTYAEFAPNWKHILENDNVVNGPTRLMLGREADTLRMAGVISALAVPLFIDDVFWGFTLFEDRRNERYFDDDCSEIMRSAAFLCANTVIRAKIERDVREKNELNKKMMEEIKNALFEVQEANHAKSEFLSRMSHEMLTPMNAIMGMTQIAKMIDSSGKTNEYLDQIDESSRHLLRLINDLLDISDKKDSAFRLVDLDFSLKGVIRNVLKDISRDLKKKQQALTFDIDQSIPASLTGDENRLAQVITNLLANSIKFTHEHGKIHFSARVIEEDNETVTLQIEVADNGIGIPKDKQSEIFSIFEQADGNLSRKHVGAGLGLALSERIVEMMGGKIWVDSEPDKGSKFMFTCKLKK